MTRLTVRVRNILYDVRHRYSPSVFIPEYNDYTGDVAPRPSWCNSDQFALTTGDEDAPIRIIESDSIICGWLHRGMDDIRVVSIPGKHGKRYTVTVADSGRLSCNCTGFGYRKTCSHVTEVMEAI